MNATQTLFDFSCVTIDGKAKDLKDFAGQVLLVVNTASKCGFTPQLAGLEELYARYRERGFAVLGFPCNQFGGQEPGTEAEIGSFCERNYGVQFPMFSKVDVNGADTDPVFSYLKKAAPGALGTQAIKWNFTKFLVDRAGNVVRRYAPATKPADIAADIESLLDA